MNNLQPVQITSEIIEQLEDIDSNLVYILKELPRNEIDDDLRRRIAVICNTFRCTLDERRRETALFGALLHETSEVGLLADQLAAKALAKNIVAGISFACSELHQIIDHLHELYARDRVSEVATVTTLVEESGVNILNALWSIRDTLLPFLPVPSKYNDMFSWIPVEWPK